MRELDGLTARKAWVLRNPDKSAAVLAITLDIAWNLAEDLVEEYTHDYAEPLPTE